MPKSVRTKRAWMPRENELLKRLIQADRLDHPSEATTNWDRFYKRLQTSYPGTSLARRSLPAIRSHWHLMHPSERVIKQPAISPAHHAGKWREIGMSTNSLTDSTHRSSPSPSRSTPASTERPPYPPAYQPRLRNASNENATPERPCFEFSPSPVMSPALSPALPLPLLNSLGATQHSCPGFGLNYGLWRGRDTITQLQRRVLGDGFEEKYTPKQKADDSRGFPLRLDLCDCYRVRGFPATFNIQALYISPSELLNSVECSGFYRGLATFE